MNIAMFIVGTAIFTIFIICIAWDIGYNEDKVNEENRGYYSRHGDSQDYDGMGNYGRFPNKENKQK